MLVFTPMKKHIYWSGEVTLHSCHTQHNNSIIITLWESIKFVFATFLRPHLSTQLFVSESSERTQPPLASLSQAWFPDHSRSGSHDPAITSRRRGHSLNITHSKGVFTYRSLWLSVTSDVPHQWPCLPPIPWSQGPWCVVTKLVCALFTTDPGTRASASLPAECSLQWLQPTRAPCCDKDQ